MLVWSEEEGRVVELGGEARDGCSSDIALDDCATVTELKRIITEQQQLLQKQFHIIEEQRVKLSQFNAKPRSQTEEEEGALENRT